MPPGRRPPADPDIPNRIAARAALAGVPVSASLAAALATYVELLRTWNRKINLTGLQVDPPSDDAIDRLTVEPLAAATYVVPADRRCIDVGSGGGSPGIPLKLARPALELVLVEAKSRKAAFLREVVRRLQLTGVMVERTRLAELAAKPEFREAADLVTLRGVRLDRELSVALQALLKPEGRVFLFGSVGGVRAERSGPWRTESRLVLVPALQSELVIMRRASAG